MTDSELLKALRKKKRWTQAEAAEHFGFKNQAYISIIERGVQPFSGPARKLAEVLYHAK